MSVGLLPNAQAIHALPKSGEAVTYCAREQLAKLVWINYPFHPPCRQ